MELVWEKKEIIYMKILEKIGQRMKNDGGNLDKFMIKL